MMNKALLKNPRLHTQIYNNLRLEVTAKGFTLWDADVERWILDASLVLQKGIVTVSDVDNFPSHMEIKTRHNFTKDGIVKRGPEPKKKKSKKVKVGK